MSSSGASRDLLIIWDTQFAEEVEILERRFVLFVSFEMKGKGNAGLQTCMVPLGTNTPRNFRRNWMPFMAYVGNLGGDSNACRSPLEKLDDTRTSRTMNSFNAFLEECQHRDFPLSNG